MLHATSNGLEYRRQRKVTTITEVYEYLRTYFPSALILLLTKAASAAGKISSQS